MAGTGVRRSVGMRGPRTRAWGRMDALVPARWRRRRAEEFQVPGDAVSPPGPGREERDGGVPGHAPLGLASPRGPSREEARPGSRPRPPGGVGEARARGRGQGRGRGAAPLRPLPSAPARRCGSWSSCSSLSEGADPVSFAVSLTLARARGVRAAAPESRPHVQAPDWAGWGCGVSGHAWVECFERRELGEVR